MKLKLLFLMTLIASSLSFVFYKTEALPGDSIQILQLEKQAIEATIKKNYEKSIAIYTKILVLNPSNSSYYLFKRAQSFNLQGDYIEALSDLDNSIQSTPHFIEALHARGILYLNKLKNNEKALQDFSRCIEILQNKKNRNNELFYTLIGHRGITKMNLSLDEEGLKDCKEAERHLTKESQDVLSCYALYHAHKKEYKEALNYAEKLLSLNPSMLNYYIHGFILYYLERYDESMKSLNESTRLGNSSYEVFLHKGNIYNKKRNYQSAKEEFDKAISNGGNKVFFLYGKRGAAKWYLNDLNGALSDYNKAIELNDKDDIAYSNKCEVLEQLNRLDEALSNCNKSIELDKDHANPYQYRAKIFKRQSKPQLALKDALEAKRLYELKPKIEDNSDYHLLNEFIESLKDSKN